MPADLEWKKVELGDWDELLQIADIRNAGREWYTNDTRYIPPHLQLQWFLNADRTLWAVKRGNIVVGFALLTDRDGKVWIGLGVRPGYQGQGIGTCIYARFFNVWAEVREDNLSSLRAAEKAGYMRVGETLDGKVWLHS